MLSDNEIMAQVRAAFREEQAEHRQAVGELLLDLERNPDQAHHQKLLDQLFREAHSLKGGARAAQYPEIEQIAHQIEDLFGAVRQGSRQLTSEICDLVHAALDAIGVLMHQAAEGQPVDLASYQSHLAALARGLGASTGAVSPAPAGEQGPIIRETRRSTTRQPASDNRPAASEHPAPGMNTYMESSGTTVRLPTTVLDELLNEAGELMTCAIGVRQQARQARELAEMPARWRRLWRQAQPTLNRLRAYTPALHPTIHYLDGRTELPIQERLYGGEHDIEALIQVLSQTNVLIADLERRLALYAHQADEEQARLHAVADRLHQQVRRTCMLPVATIFSPLRIQLREVARAAGKQLQLVLDDGGAEADRQVLERLGEVLLHLLCNAVDHGIEATEARIAVGKPAEGQISLRAEVSGDRLTLTIADDGAGLDLPAIRQRALAGGERGAADLARISEANLVDLIFQPGFSTRSTVSTLSGRGVGLDVVRSRVERMRGHITVHNIPGAGCTFIISLPLSLTSSHGLLLRAGNTSYVLALDSIQRIIPVSMRDICMIEGRPALVVDDKPLALVHLTALLGHTSAGLAGNAASIWHGLLIGSADRQIVCLVDMVLGEQELVVHRLPPPLQQVPCIAGATILADGTVVPILDMADLLRAALGTRQTMSLASASIEPARRTAALIVDDSITTRTLEKNILEAAGYRVHLAVDGIEALQVLDQLVDHGGCDLILCDVDMPRLNGFELTERVRADSRFQHLPVVLITSLDTKEDHARGIAAGADAYIVKRYFDQQTLLDTIGRLI